MWIFCVYSIRLFNETGDIVVVFIYQWTLITKGAGSQLTLHHVKVNTKITFGCAFLVWFGTSIERRYTQTWIYSSTPPPLPVM